MITNLRIQNFKSWQDTGSMNFSKLTGFFGPNSSGKTSIIQLLLILKQTLESSDRTQVLNFGDETTLANLGTFRDTIHHESKTGASNAVTNASSNASSIDWSVSWRLPKSLPIKNSESHSELLFSPQELTFEASILEKGSKKLARVICQKFRYNFIEESYQYAFGMERKNNDRDEYELIHTGFDPKRTQGRPWPLPSPVKFYGFPAQATGYYQNAGFLPDFNLALEELFSRVFYLGPLREYPRREYTWGGGQPSDMGRRGERVIDALLASRERGEKIARGKGRPRATVEEYVAIWLRELGLIHSFAVEAITESSNLYQVRVQKTASSPSVLITDVGFGVSQVLPVLTLCFYVPEGSTIILEQPEIHLHPLVQAGLADVFIDAMKKRKIQIILESHSEHLLTRLQRRIAEEEIKSEDASLYFCERDNASVSKLRSLKLDAFGNIKNWPTDFFGDEFAERTAMVQAGIRRKRNSVSA